MTGFLVPPSLAEVTEKYRVIYDNMAYDAIFQPIYDFQEYPQAGFKEMNFFQVQRGQGNKTIQDTNMEAAGAFPTSKMFAAMAIEVHFYPGVMPESTGTVPTENTGFLNEVYKVYKAGSLNLFIGNKSYLDDSPLMTFPPSTKLSGFGFAADTSTAAADKLTLGQYAMPVGRLYTIGVTQIESMQNFNVKITFKEEVPISANGRIGVKMLGWMYRQVQ